MNSKTIIKDPLYKQILVSDKYMKYVDSAQFQRLRYIKQTSSADLVYPNANHTRFSHSIGAYHLMKKVVDNGHMKLSKQEKEDLFLAALLHDIGHGPFSHLWEKIFPHFNHEEATIEMLKEFKLDSVVKIIKKESHLSPLITSTLDIDKLDYMARDSYFAGVSYGVTEVDFITQRMYLKNNKLVIRPSCISSVEDLITQRVNLIKTVYLHKGVEQFEHIFYLIFSRVRDLLNQDIAIDINPHILAFFNQTNTLNDLLQLNDSVVICELMKWQHHEDKLLSSLCRKYLRREKINAINLEHTTKTLDEFKEKFNKNLSEPYQFYVSKYSITILQTPVYVEFDDGNIIPLKDVSKIINFYSTIDLNIEYLFYL